MTLINIKVLLICHTKFQPNIPSHFGEMDFNACINVNFIQAQDILIIAKIRKGNNTIIICDRVMVLALYTSSDDLLPMYRVLFNSLFYTFRDMLQTNRMLQKRKGSYSVNTGDRVMVLAFCNSLHGTLSVYHVSFNYL